MDIKARLLLMAVRLKEILLIIQIADIEIHMSQYRQPIQCLYLPKFHMYLALKFNFFGARVCKFNWSINWRIITNTDTAKMLPIKPISDS